MTTINEMLKRKRAAATAKKWTARKGQSQEMPKYWAGASTNYPGHKKFGGSEPSLKKKVSYGTYNLHQYVRHGAYGKMPQFTDTGEIAPNSGDPRAISERRIYQAPGKNIPNAERLKYFESMRKKMRQLST